MMTKNSIIKRKQSISKYLSKQFGGKWKYDGFGSWSCDDEKRIVRRVASSLDDEYDHVYFPSYYLYGDGVPKQLFL